jgi:glutaminyl-tRNA synthetase
MRRRGIPAEALKDFCNMIGVSKRESLIDMSMLDACTRHILNYTSNRRMVVFNPLKVTITNWYVNHDKEEWMSADVNPENKEAGVRMVNFGHTLYVEREDFMEDAPKKFFRLSEGREVRFKYGYYVTCNEVVKDENGEVIELLCTYDPETKGGWSDDGRKVKGTIHWVNADNHKPITVNLYDRLFTTEVPSDDFLNELNPDSIVTVDAMMEGAGPHAMDKFLQFERNGYYVEDSKGVWNRTLPMRDGYKIKK